MKNKHEVFDETLYIMGCDYCKRSLKEKFKRCNCGMKLHADCSIIHLREKNSRKTSYLEVIRRKKNE